jgi:hypothetical protein
VEHTITLHMARGAIIVAAAVGLSVLASTFIVSRSIDRRTRTQAASVQDVTVKGSARQRVTSDTAVWTILVRGEAPKLTDAFLRVSSAATEVTDYLRERGFTDAEILESAVDTATFYKRDATGSETREVSGYALSREITVTSSNVARVAGAASEVTELIRQGFLIESRAPEFTYSKLADLRVQIQGQAALDARTRAQEIAAKAGGRIGAIRDVQAGVLQLTRPNDTDVSGYGMYDTATIEKDVTAVVTITFGIE